MYLMASKNMLKRIDESM